MFKNHLKNTFLAQKGMILYLEMHINYKILLKHKIRISRLEISNVFYIRILINRKILLK